MKFVGGVIHMIWKQKFIKDNYKARKTRKGQKIKKWEH